MVFLVLKPVFTIALKRNFAHFPELLSHQPAVKLFVKKILIMSLFVYSIYTLYVLYV